MPRTCNIKFVTKFVTLRRLGLSYPRKYIHMYINGQREELSRFSQINLFVCLCIRELVHQGLRNNFSHVLFSQISYSFFGIANIRPLWHICSYHTNKSIKLLYGNLFHFSRYFNEIRHKLVSKTVLQFAN